MTQIRVTDSREGSVGAYTLDGFRSWVYEVFMEGYKRDAKFPTLGDALEIVKACGCTVETLP